jgi:hypothetical protein
MGPLPYAAEMFGACVTYRWESPAIVVAGSDVAYMWLWLVGGADTHGFVNCGCGYLIGS